MTLAPRSASWRVAKGAATACSRETTVIPSRGRFAPLIAGTRQDRTRIPLRLSRLSRIFPAALHRPPRSGARCLGYFPPLLFLSFYIVFSVSDRVVSSVEKGVRQTRRRLGAMRTSKSAGKEKAGAISPRPKCSALLYLTRILP